MSEQVTVPDFECDGAHNNQEVIRKFCELQAAAWRALDEPCSPADCFCGQLQRLDTAPVRTFDDGYRNDLRTFRFIEWATWTMIRAVKPDAVVPTHVAPLPSTPTTRERRLEESLMECVEQMERYPPRSPTPPCYRAEFQEAVKDARAALNTKGNP